MEFSIDLKTDSDVVQSDNGTKYRLSSIIAAINEFNKKCPKRGGMIERSEVGSCRKFTHVTTSLKYEKGKLIANIEFLKSEYESKNYSMKPIIAIPLRFGSGIEVENVLKIVNIFLEEI